MSNYQQPPPPNDGNDNEGGGRDPPPNRPQGYLSDHFDPHILPQGDAGTPDFVHTDVMDSDGVSTITGPLGAEDFDPVGVYTHTAQQHLHEQQEPMDDNYYNQQQQQEQQDQPLQRPTHDNDTLDGQGQFTGGGGGRQVAPRPAAQDINNNMAAEEEDYERFEEEGHQEYDERGQQLVEQQDGDPDSFRRKEYNARVEEWYNQMEQAADEGNADSGRMSYESNTGGGFMPGVPPNQPPAAEPRPRLPPNRVGGNQRPPQHPPQPNHYNNNVSMNNRPPSRPPPSPSPSPMPYNQNMNMNNNRPPARPPPPPSPSPMYPPPNYYNNNPNANQQYPNKPPPYSYPPGSAQSPQRPPYPPPTPVPPMPPQQQRPPRPPPPPMQYGAASQQDDEEDTGLRICWLIVACVALVVVAVGATLTFLYLFTDIITIPSSDDGNDGNNETTTDTPTVAPTMAATTQAPTLPQLSLAAVQTFNGETESFGRKVFLSDRFIVIGSPDAPLGAVNSFAAQSGTGNTTLWNSIPELTQASGFGTDFALVQLTNSNNDVLLFVGSPKSSSGQGNVLLYRYQSSDNRWIFQDNEDGTLAGAGTPGEAFGTTVAIGSGQSGTLIVIGAPGFQTGRVYTFFLANGDQPGQFTAPPLLAAPLLGTALDARFGAALDITTDGTFMAVGQPGQSSFSIFSWDGGDWDKVFTFTLSQANDLGSSVAFLSSDHVAVGGPSFDNGRGMVRVFHLTNAADNGSWEPLEELAGSADGDRLGASLSGYVSPQGEVELILGTANGAVERYDYINGAWQLRFSVDTNNAVSAVDYFRKPANSQFTILVGIQDAQSAILYDTIERETPLSETSSVPSVTPSSTSASPSTTTGAPSISPTNMPTGSPTVPKFWLNAAGPFSSSESFNSDFGFSVALVDDFLLVGEPLGGVVAEGRVVGFSRSGNYSSVPFDFSLATLTFGYSLDVAVVAGTPSVVVGARNTKFNNPFSNTLERFGSAHYFEFDGQNWVEVGDTIEPILIVTEAGAAFGGSVAMSSASRRIAVAAPSSSTSGQLTDTGKIYSFEFDGSDWVQMAPVLFGERANMFLGSSLDMSADGTMLLAGSPNDGGGDGSITLYEWTGSIWNETFFLQAEASSLEDLGRSVAFVTDRTFALGGPNHGSGRGVIRLYEKTDDGTFQKMTDIVGETGEGLGITISTSNAGRFAAGTRGGSFHVFAQEGQSFVEIPSTGGPSSLGSAVTSISISADGTTVAVGSVDEEVLVYELAPL